MKEANFAPVYAAMYTRLAELAREQGYALAVHGSLAADLDLVCIPWTREASEPERVVQAIEKTFAIERIGTYKTMEHGRLAITLSITFGICRIDLSFMPRILNDEKP